MPHLKDDLVLDALRKRRVMRSRDLVALGVSNAYLKEMADKGQLWRVGRGLYAPPNYDYSHNPSLTELAAHAPHATICLLSALLFHNLTTALPNETWAAIPTGSRAPHIGGLGLQVVRVSSSTFDEGVETHTLDGVDVRIYSVVRTVSMCFKYRNLVGMEFTIDALREGLRERLFSLAQVLEIAAVDRVQNVMLPYVQALV